MIKIENVGKGKKANFRSIEDLLQTFFCIAGSIYEVVSHDDDINEKGVLEMLANDHKGRIRIRVDYVKEGEDEC